MKKYNDLLIVDNSKVREYIPLSQIIYIEKYKGGTKIHRVSPSSFFTSIELENVNKLIDDNNFIEINDAQIFNTRYLKSRDKQFVTTILQQKLPVTKLLK